VSAATLLMGLELLGQIVGLVKQMIIAAQFGTSSELDGYLVAVAIAWLLRAWVMLPVKQTLIPIFRHDLAQLGETAAWRRLSVLFNNIGVLLVVLGLLVALAAPLLVDLVGPGLSASADWLAAWLVRILVIGLVFDGLQNVLAQVMFSYRRFALPGVAGALDNVAVVAALLLIGGRWGVVGLAVAVVLGSLVQLLVQLPVLWWHRALYVPSVDLRAPAMTEMRRLSLPLLLTAGGSEVARLTDRIFASLLPVGSLSALAFAHRLAVAANNLFIDTLQQATFPHFTQLSAEQKFGALSRQLFRYLRLLLFVAIPVAAALGLLAEVLVRVAYQRGAFDETSVQLTSQCLLFYALGFPALSASRLLSRTFFGLKDTRTPAKVAMLRLVLRVLLCWALVGPLAHVGIALADSVSEVVKAVLLFFLLPAHIKREEGRETLRSVVTSLAGAALMIGVMVVTRQALGGALPAAGVVAVTAAGAVTYLASMALLNGDETRTLWKTATVLRARLLS
jgi:putative peptidoglycan lipid II flippase